MQIGVREEGHPCITIMSENTKPVCRWGETKAKLLVMQGLQKKNYNHIVNIMNIVIKGGGYITGLKREYIFTFFKCHWLVNSRGLGLDTLHLFVLGSI